MFADTLQLSAYTAQNTRLAHRRTASKRERAQNNAPMNPKNKAILRRLGRSVRQCKSGCSARSSLDSYIAKKPRFSG